MRHLDLLSQSKSLMTLFWSFVVIGFCLHGHERLKLQTEEAKTRRNQYRDIDTGHEKWKVKTESERDC